MKAIIPVAWYATRLFPLTEDLPKTLLEVNGKTILDHTIEKVEELGIDEIYITTNNKFYNHFLDWNQDYNWNSKIIILNDNTTSNEDRLWAIWDIHYTIKTHGIDSDVLVIWGDNLFKFSLHPTHELFQKHKKPTIIWYDLQDWELAKKYGIVEPGQNKKVIGFEEKPADPKSTLVATCVYFYPRETLPVIGEYLEAGNNPDSPGNFPAWLVNNGHDVYVQNHTEDWFDIWSFESLKEAKEEYGESNVDIEKLKRGEA